LRIEEAQRQSEKPPKTSHAPTRWLVVREENGRLEPLCVEEGKARMLAVFSFEEQAEMFVRLGDYDAGRWRARESGAGELVSVLCGPCAETRGVALDPLPKLLKDGTASLLRVGRRRFLGRLLAEGGERAAS
jgi:hypothetical protein